MKIVVSMCAICHKLANNHYQPNSERMNAQISIKDDASLLKDNILNGCFRLKSGHSSSQNSVEFSFKYTISSLKSGYQVF